MISRVEKILGVCDKYREDVKLLNRQVSTIKKTLDRYETDIDDKLDEKMLCDKSSELFKKIADNRNKEAKKQIEEVLNYALSNIPLEQDYEAIMEETTSKRSGKELDIVLIDKNTGQRRSLRNQTGTWIVQVISFILTMIVIKFSGSSRIMVLDEVFTGMEDHNMIKMFGDILVALTENEDFQIFMVEHRKELDSIDEITDVELGIEDYKKGTQVVE